jgi:hypothetical protein
MGKVVLQGDSPFDLGTAQRAIVLCANGGVEMSLFAILPDHGPRPLQIPVLLSVKVARQLAEDLSAAAVEAELRANRSS